ncbi:MAG: M1 family metallopeptidase [Deltaproteobacteria bacterium]|nr:M1 family metallopeptidase [Deltaproteobacteria bacterium]
MPARLGPRIDLRLAALPFAALLFCEPAHGLSAVGPDAGVDAFAPSGTLAQYAPERVLDLEHAAIHVVPDLVGRQVAGVIELRARVLDPSAREITLHGVDLTIEAATIDGQPSAIRLDDERVHLALPQGVREPGAISEIRLRWRAEPDLGLYFFGPDERAARLEALREDPEKEAKRGAKNKKGIPERAHALQAWTQGETHETRHWLPIWDYPNDRFTTSWTVAAAAGFSVIANGESGGLAPLDQLAPERGLDQRLEADAGLVALGLLDLVDHGIDHVEVGRHADLGHQQRVHAVARLLHHVHHVAVHVVGVEPR